jgi:crotonobetainyl-CoA:carnitine CoA-transferase CaiB-like acyl-CoA transferase
MLACNAVLAALNARHTTGKGQKVEVSLYETSLAMLANVASSHLISGNDAGRYGNGHPSIVPYTTYRAADQMFAVAVGNDGQFRKFCEALGHPEWADDARFAANSARVQNRSALDELIDDALVGQPAASWIEKLKAGGIPCGLINTVAQALADPQTQARAMVETVTHPTAGAMKMLGIPMKFSGTPASVRTAPPTLGQHSDEILRDMLGYDAARIAVLRAQQVI